MSIYSHLFARAQQEQRMVGVRSNTGEPGRFAVGFVQSYSEEALLLRVINRDGMQTGLQSFNLSDVFQVDFNDQYIRNVEFKANNLDRVYASVKTPSFLTVEELSTPYLLEMAREHEQLIYLTTYVATNFYGYVRQLTEREVLMECYTESGTADGLAAFRVDDVRHVVWSDEDTRVIELHLKLQAGK
ncbi:hypothetical protein MUN82_09445 [Hymenobacter aerilatus]|uniref:Uncharacterized protein n=1 Tax=Hymenobacter aerilatus TaxID=2932251 RepID=A0A8T9T0C1_9BACT|nr:hypothetical protein [Hymenobacter aerilatus]UOR07307.1 hypothetical protein MUN82_09445 [Hymenobacter aerilatus]